MSKESFFIQKDAMQKLLDILQAEGYACLGPQVRDHTIVYDTISKLDQLPRGVSESQSPGSYKLEQTDSGRYFAWANGPQALKPLVFSPRETLWQARSDENNVLQFSEQLPDAAKLAVIGVRACDIAALFIHDKHFLQDGSKDPYYLRRRQNLFLVAVNCTHPAETCFCASTDDGPKATYGYDIALTELEDGFVIDARSHIGVEVLAKLETKPSTDEQVTAAQIAMTEAIGRQTRQLPGDNLQKALFANLTHERWQQVAQRCLSCGNCTAVCPTCFCYSEMDDPQLDGLSSDHVRQWDSCFTTGHSYIHGITIRAEVPQRYRQWLTHKLGSWHEQYGRSGCVGCGRCITWCPVGIDITEEANVICGGSE